ncbi:uncharacterized protein PHALS_12092 [Plasmopara halstedii]|uniref:Uncharacterized protein n=1 Tax=Plasmopara halstedii TaxID=4781 RepID=A0A0N7L5K9_PLAHL|nr:uncharacterized protein PHALS_12092 [Plasmopara halstedii]CEG41763.1 hypothetical protein PHALS_12092 [Plasmopara halstedii]|eukprot:XP_024578132.1 hypothetical protein PHALS_12092 [Plasmopara halstedii]
MGTGKLRKIDFGAGGYTHYRDQTPLEAYSHLDHKNKKKRQVSLEINTRNGLRTKQKPHDEPAQVIGSTIMHADQIAALGDSAFVPIRDAKTGEEWVYKLKEKKYILRNGE